MFNKLSSNQKGIIHTLPLLIIIAAVGIISFLLISSTLPLNGLFGELNPKPKSNAQMAPMEDQCKFFTAPGAVPAFCDVFNIKNPGGRAGDLDEVRWQYGRTNNFTNPPGQVFAWEPVTVNFCTQIKNNILPPNDSFICGQEFNEANHWMESMNDGGAYVWDSATIRQPFDFTNRTGVITFDLDAKTAGGHTWWPNVCVTDEVYSANEGAGAQPKNGFCINFGLNTGQPAGKTPTDSATVGLGGIDSVYIFNNWNISHHLVDAQGSTVGKYTTQADHANHMELRISKTNMEIWVSDKTDDHGMTFPNFRKIAILNGINLPITRGFVSFGQVHYNASKDGMSPHQTYHWHGVGFDGPVFPTLRGYDVLDSMVPDGGGAVNLGYFVDPQGLHKPGGQIIPSFTFNNVNLSAATSANLSVTMGWPWFDTADLAYRFNGGTWNIFPFPSQDPGATGEGNIANGHPMYLPVQVSDLKQGANTLELKLARGRMMSMANISLNIGPGDVLPLLGTYTSTPVNGTPMPSMSPIPSGSVMPSSTSQPTSTPSSCPKALLGDIDCDGRIGIFDYNILITNFGKTGTSIQGDLDKNGIVGIFDYNILIGNFGK